MRVLQGPVARVLMSTRKTVSTSAISTELTSRAAQGNPGFSGPNQLSAARGAFDTLHYLVQAFNTHLAIWAQSGTS